MKRQTINGRTRPIVLLGHPVAHSASPLFHNHLLASRKLPFVYLALDVEPDRLDAAITGLRAVSFAGANITIPHKKAACRFCDHLTPLSEKTGTVNTLFWKDSALWGTTTDATGFMNALSAIPFDPKEKKVLILGNGGTARTLAVFLAMERIPATLTLAGRHAGRVEALASEIAESTGFPVAAGVLTNADLVGQADLIVNATPVGMHPRPDASPLDSSLLTGRQTVFDTVYNPATTRLVHEARTRGCTAVNGLNMLLFQGIASLELWTGVKTAIESIDCDEIQQQISPSPLPGENA